MFIEEFTKSISNYGISAASERGRTACLGTMSLFILACPVRLGLFALGRSGEYFYCKIQLK